jgi:hypothetical protein
MSKFLNVKNVLLLSALASMTTGCHSNYLASGANKSLAAKQATYDARMIKEAKKLESKGKLAEARQIYLQIPQSSSLFPHAQAGLDKLRSKSEPAVMDLVQNAPLKKLQSGEQPLILETPSMESTVAEPINTDAFPQNETAYVEPAAFPVSDHIPVITADLIPTEVVDPIEVPAPILAPAPTAIQATSPAKPAKSEPVVTVEKEVKKNAILFTTDDAKPCPIPIPEIQPDLEHADWNKAKHNSTVGNAHHMAATPAPVPNADPATESMANSEKTFPLFPDEADSAEPVCTDKQCQAVEPLKTVLAPIPECTDKQCQPALDTANVAAHNPENFVLRPEPEPEVASVPAAVADSGKYLFVIPSLDELPSSDTKVKLETAKADVKQAFKTLNAADLNSLADLKNKADSILQPELVAIPELKPIPETLPMPVLSAADEQLNNLISQLHSDKTQEKALIEISQLGSNATGAFSAIDTILKTGPENNRPHAAYAYHAITNDRAVPIAAWREGLRSVHPETVELSAYYLGTMGQEAAAAIPDLEALMANGDEMIQVHAAEALIQIQKNHSSATLLLSKIARTGSQNTRLLAISALSNVTPGSNYVATETLYNLTQDTDGEIASSALLALSTQSSHDARFQQILVKCTAHQLPEVRQTARLTLAHMQQQMNVMTELPDDNTQVTTKSQSGSNTTQPIEIEPSTK